MKIKNVLFFLLALLTLFAVLGVNSQSSYRFIDDYYFSKANTPTPNGVYSKENRPTLVQSNINKGNATDVVSEIQNPASSNTETPVNSVSSGMEIQMYSIDTPFYKTPVPTKTNTPFPTPREVDYGDRPRIQ